MEDGNGVGPSRASDAKQHTRTSGALAQQGTYASSRHGLADSRRAALRRWGTDSWFALGIIALVMVLFAGLGAISSVAVPVAVAVILGVVMQPFVYWLERHGVSRAMAATTVLLVALIAAAGLVALVVWGLVKEVPEMYSQFMRGWSHFLLWVESWDVEGVWLERMRQQVVKAAPTVGGGAIGVATSTLSGTLTFIVASFFSIFVLFFVLRDGRRFPSWLARTVGYNEQVVQDVAGVTSKAMLGYFKSTAITALITGPIFIIPLVILRVPLVVPIFLLYFFLSFVPYIGAFATGLFAALIAFGSAGPTAALIVLVALLISNGAIQNAVLSWTMGSSLKIHPVTVLIATLVGGVVAGMMGMILGAPLAAATLKSARVVKDFEAQTNAENVAEPSNPNA